MGGTETQRAWVTRVLGRDPWSLPATLRTDASARVAAPSPAAEAGAVTPAQPFQIFVRSLDEVTLTFQLPNGSATTLGELRGMIERRTGISLNEHRLQFRTKEFNAAHASLAVAEYGVQPDQTLTLLGRLRGGFGERAAAADVILRGIRAGNVVSDIVATGGESRARAAFGRHMLQEDKRQGMEKEAALFQNFKAALYKKLATDKLLPNGVASEAKLEAWMKDNMTSLSAIACSNLQAGTCADYANLVYTSLISNTKNQSVYRAGMSGPYDHAFVITSPADHGDDIEKLYNDPDAMVVDAWCENKICSFKEFADSENPYGKKLDRKHLAVRRHETATGKPPLSKEFEKAMNSVMDAFFEEASNQDWLAKRVKKFKQNADDIVAAEQKVTVCERDVSYWEKQLEDDKDKPQFKLLWEQKRDDAKRDLAAAKQALDDAKGPLLFGSADEPWDRDTIGDLRTNDEMLRTLDQAFKKGGFKQLEAEMDELTDAELLSVCKQMKQADNAKFKKYLFGVKPVLWLRYSKLDAAEKKARQAQAPQAQGQPAQAQQAPAPPAQVQPAQVQQPQAPQAQARQAQIQPALAV